MLIDNGANTRTVLWIEDELLDETQYLLVSRLEQHGWGQVKIEPAQHLEEAEEILDQMRHSPPDLIILDCMLARDEDAAKADPPRVDMNAGYLLWYSIRKLTKASDAIHNVPIVIMTARGNPEFGPALEEDERLLWLNKPMSGEEVADSIVNWLSGDQASTK